MIEREDDPGILISFHYWHRAQKVFDHLKIRDWVLDSGAFSAANSGVDIDLDEYIEFCREVLDGPNPPSEVFALDVIGDGEGTRRNTERMWEAGIEAIPAYHIGEPEDLLLHYAKTYPKIAFGGVALLKTHRKFLWAEACFARVWPKKVHGFGFGAEKAVMGLPFHSTDATSWEVAPAQFGRFKAFSGGSTAGVQLPIKSKDVNLRSEVEWYLDLERRARLRWKSRMTELDVDPKVNPTVRLAVANYTHPRFTKAFRPLNPTTS